MSRNSRNRRVPRRPENVAIESREPVAASPGGRSGGDSLEDEIRLRAYYRYLERETEPRAEAESADEVTDWLEAESDVLGRRATGVEADERARDDGA
jgi:hypothetical protein